MRPVYSTYSRYYRDPPPCDNKSVRTYNRRSATGKRELPDADTGDDSSSSPPPLSRAIYPSLYGISNPPATRMLALRLLHNFSTVLCNYLPLSNTPVGIEIWATMVPQVSFSNENLLPSIFAMAALHLKHLNPTMSSLDGPVLRYCHKALTEQKRAETDHRQTIILAISSGLTIIMPTLVSKLLSLPGPF